MDRTKIAAENAKEIIREAEAYLSAQLTAGIAIDQKAMTLAGSIATIVVAVIGIALATLSTDDPNLIIAWASGSCAVPLLVSLILAVCTARPIKFEYVGNTPSAWRSTDDLYGPLSAALMSQAEHYTDAIRRNNVDLERNGKLMRWAAGLMAAAPFVGLTSALVVWVLGT